MTFYIGQKKAGEIFLGGKKVGRIYLGQTLVHMTAVVSEPTFLEYIETDGNSYIDTGYLPSGNTYVEYTFEIISKPASTFNGLFGSRQDNSRYPYNVFCRDSLQLRIDYGKYSETQYQCASNTKYTIRAGNNEFYINDKLVKSYTDSNTGTSPYSMYLGNFNNAGTPYATGTAQKIYGWKVYENNVLSQDLRPALDPSGKVCMYDTVSGKYFYNAGTGELKAGGRFVESIVFDGKSYIDTGYLPNEQTYVEYTFEVYNASVGTANFQGLFGSRKDQTVEGYNFNVFVRSADYLRIDWGVYVGNLTNYSLNTKYTMKAGLGEVYLDDTLVKTYTVPATGTSPYSIYLGNFNNAGKPYTSGALQKVYGFKVYENNALIQDLRPYVDSDGVACFKDVVTDTLFYNKGTGTLTYTEYESLEFIYLDGNQYIDTGIVLQSCTVETAVKYEAGHSRRMLNGWVGNYGLYWGMQTNGQFEQAGANLSSRTNLTDYTKINIVYDLTANTVIPTVDGETKTYNISGTTTNTYTIGCSVPTSANKVIGNVYYHKIYDVDGKLIQDLIPVKRSDGVKCMYDRVENKYYELKGA